MTYQLRNDHSNFVEPLIEKIYQGIFKEKNSRNFEEKKQDCRRNNILWKRNISKFKGDLFNKFPDLEEKLWKSDKGISMSSDLEDIKDRALFIAGNNCEVKGQYLSLAKKHSLEAFWRV